MALHSLKYLSFAIVVGSALSVVACDDDDNGGTQPTDSGWYYDTLNDFGSNEAGTRTDSGLDGGDATVTDSSGSDAMMEVGDAALSEGQVATIVRTANDGEIELANAVLTRLTTTQGQRYATMMVDEHTAAKTRQAQLFQTLGIVESPTDVAVQLTSMVAALKTQLASQSGLALDLAYLNSQATMHDNVLVLIDTQLVPSATKQQLRDELTLTRQTVSAHATEARSYSTQLTSDGGGGEGGSGDAADAADAMDSSNAD